MNTGFSAVLSCFYRKYRRWHLCLKQLATAPFFHLKLTPCKVGGTPQVLSWGPEPQPSPGASCGVPRGGMGLSFLCPPRPCTALPPGEALNVHVPLPPVLLFPSSQVQKHPLLLKRGRALPRMMVICSNGCPATSHPGLKFPSQWTDVSSLSAEQGPLCSPHPQAHEHFLPPRIGSD